MQAINSSIGPKAMAKVRWTVVAPVANFGSVEAAGDGEDSIDWMGPENGAWEACTLGFAAMEVADSLRSLGCEVVLKKWDGTLPSSPSVVILGPRSFGSPELIRARFGAVELPAGAQSFVLRTFLEGQLPSYLILGGGRSGCLYGAYELLNQLGFHWHGPEAKDAVIPAAPPESWPVVETSQAPSFETRGFFVMTSGVADRAFFLWMARNKMNAWATEKSAPWLRKLGFVFFEGEHDAQERYLPPKRYFETHTEWYGLHDGRRQGLVNRGDQGHGAVNMCFTNAEARREIAANLVEDLISGPRRWADYVNIWHLDNGAWCQCANCAAAGNRTDLLFLLCHDCRKAIGAARREGRLHREVNIVLASYHETLPPPSRPLPPDFDHDHVIVIFFPIERCYAHTLADPKCAETNAPLRKVWENWCGEESFFRGQRMIGEYYGVSSFGSVGIPFTRTMAEDISYYFQTGARHLNFMHPFTGKCWGALSLSQTQFAALTWNHRQDSKAWLDRFLSARFGDLAGALGGFINLLEAAMRSCKQILHFTGRLVAPGEVVTGRQDIPGYVIASLRTGLLATRAPEQSDQIFRTRHLQYNRSEEGADDAPSLVETVRLLESAQHLLDAALLGTEDPAVALRLVSDACRFTYTRNRVQFIYHLVRVRLFERQQMRDQAATEARLLRSVGEALRMEDVVTKGCTMNMQLGEGKYMDYAASGLASTFYEPTYREILAHYGLTAELPADAGVPESRDPG